MGKENFVKEITNIEEDFAQWYTDVVKKAELADYTDTKGCIAIRPYGYAIWENIQKYADEKFKENGVKNVYFPVLIPESLLQKEKDHVEGFAPEVAWVTEAGGEKLDEKYQTLSLYSTNNTTKNSTSSSSHIIGKITIEKINLNYSILSTCSEELLKLSPCRLCGPEPNGIGNLCIAGHNYDNGKFFSNISKLSVGDKIKIYDLNNSFLEYKVYDKFEVEINNTSVLAQDTNGKKELTLITCNNKKKNRFILKAKEMD